MSPRARGAAVRRRAAVVCAAAVMVGAGAGSVGAAVRWEAASASTAKPADALLVLSDFPSGWTASGSGADTGTNAGTAALTSRSELQLVHCVGVRPTQLAHDEPHVDSPTFSDDQSTYATRVDNRIMTFPSAAEAGDLPSILGRAKATRCIAALFNGPLKFQIAEELSTVGATVGTITVDPLVAGLPSWANGFTFRLPFTTAGQTITLTASVVYFSRGRLREALSFDSVGLVFPVSLENHLLKVVYGRL